jgi:hypothetical protein
VVGDRRGQRRAVVPGGCAKLVRGGGTANRWIDTCGIVTFATVACSVLNVTVDCADGERLARFWSGVTGWTWSKQDMPGNPFWIVGDPDSAATRLVFVEVAAPKTIGWVVMADPEGKVGKGPIIDLGVRTRMS